MNRKKKARSKRITRLSVRHGCSLLFLASVSRKPFIYCRVLRLLKQRPLMLASALRCHVRQKPRCLKCGPTRDSSRVFVFWGKFCFHICQYRVNCIDGYDRTIIIGLSGKGCTMNDAGEILQRYLWCLGLSVLTFCLSLIGARGPPF